MQVKGTETLNDQSDLLEIYSLFSIAFHFRNTDECLGESA